MTQAMKKNNEGLTIIEELQSLLDSLRENEYNELKKSIEAEGIRDPIVVWKERNAILDGHNRYKIAGELGIDYETNEVSLKDIDEAKEWMIRNQLGRRNLTPAQFDYFIGQLYNQTHKVGEATAEKIAEQYGIGERTVRRAAKAATGIDKIAEVKEQIKNKLDLLKGKPEERYTQKELETVAKASSPEVVKKVVEKIDNKKKEIAQTKQAVKQAAKAPEPKPQTYQVAFVEPNFEGISFNIDTEKKPPLDTNAVVYMAVDDGFLADGLALFRKWGLTYEASFIFKIEPVEGIWSKVQHKFLIVGTKGTITGPEQGKEALSLPNGPTEPIENKMERIINAYHPKVDKLAMLSSYKTPQGWSVLSQ